jgi:hypothetical protein
MVNKVTSVLIMLGLLTGGIVVALWFELWWLMVIDLVFVLFFGMLVFFLLDDSNTYLGNLVKQDERYTSNTSS